MSVREKPLRRVVVFRAHGVEPTWRGVGAQHRKIKASEGEEEGAGLGLVYFWFIVFLLKCFGVYISHVGGSRKSSIPGNLHVQSTA